MAKRVETDKLLEFVDGLLSDQGYDSSVGLGSRSKFQQIASKMARNDQIAGILGIKNPRGDADRMRLQMLINQDQENRQQQRFLQSLKIDTMIKAKQLELEYQKAEAEREYKKTLQAETDQRIELANKQEGREEQLFERGKEQWSLTKQSLQVGLETAKTALDRAQFELEDFKKNAQTYSDTAKANLRHIDAQTEEMISQNNRNNVDIDLKKIQVEKDKFINNEFMKLQSALDNEFENPMDKAAFNDWSNKNPGGSVQEFRDERAAYAQGVLSPREKRDLNIENAASRRNAILDMIKDGRTLEDATQIYDVLNAPIDNVINPQNSNVVPPQSLETLQSIRQSAVLPGVEPERNEITPESVFKLMQLKGFNNVTNDMKNRAQQEAQDLQKIREENRRKSSELIAALRGM